MESPLPLACSRFESDELSVPTESRSKLVEPTGWYELFSQSNDPLKERTEYPLQNLGPYLTVVGMVRIQEGQDRRDIRLFLGGLVVKLFDDIFHA